ncbi:hypothetical protein FA15DRAFT_687016 [Coprinopsis marcescibilis]|uniref:Uncharacterized protein n=1 Tax=Coprinopsis marcescibilis TaxID=230819 RepID=A0A5C3KZZ0_COPMA|nr:hypothetical protein FA15DRAFT_687016 [Coprinopsis marcescibilis]
MVIYNNISDVETLLRGMPSLRRLPARTKVGLALDLALVGLSLRTGCLIDSFLPKDPVAEFSQILRTLRNTPATAEIGANIVHLFEPESEQSFLVNRNLVPLRLGPLLELNYNGVSPTFVEVSPPSHFKHLEVVPEALCSVLRYLVDKFRLDSNTGVPYSLSLPKNLHIELTVPLAAILLDYAVAYVPSIFEEDAETSHKFLAGVAVATYECTLTLGFTNKQQEGLEPEVRVMKFSCPRSLEESQPDRYSPEAISESVLKELERRIALTSSDCVVARLRHEYVTYDRLAM